MVQKNQIIISGHHLHLTEENKAWVHEKAERLFRHDHHIIRLRVELGHTSSVTRDQKRVTARGLLEVQGADMVASATGVDLHHVIVQMIGKLDRRIRDHACLVRVKRRHPHSIDLPVTLPKVDAVAS